MSLPAYLVYCVIVSGLGISQFCFNAVTTNTPQTEIMEFFKDNFARRYQMILGERMAKTLFSLTFVVFVMGAMISTSCMGSVAERFGRKKSNIYAQVIAIVGAICVFLSKPIDSFELILIGRFIQGIGTGIFSGLVPLYWSEISPVRMRGAMGSLAPIFMGIGATIAAIFGLDVMLGNKDRWHFLFIVASILPTAQLILLQFTPETPRFLIVSCGKNELGHNVLQKLRGAKEDISEEFKAMEYEREQIGVEGSGDTRGRNKGKSVSWLLSSTKYRMSLIVCVCVVFLQVSTGVHVFGTFSTKIFQENGVDIVTSKYITVGNCVLYTCMPMLCSLLMERLGRRHLLLFSSSGCILSCIGITLVLRLTHNEENVFDVLEEAPEVTAGVTFVSTTAKGMMACLASLTFFYGMGMATMPFLTANEVFDQHVRSAAVGIVQSMYWLQYMVIALCFPPLQYVLGDFVFVPIIVTGICLLSFLFIYYPETKGEETIHLAKLFQEYGWTTAVGLHSHKLLKEIKASSSFQSRSTTVSVN